MKRSFITAGLLAAFAMTGLPPRCPEDAPERGALDTGCSVTPMAIWSPMRPQTRACSRIPVDAGLCLYARRKIPPSTKTSGTPFHRPPVEVRPARKVQFFRRAVQLCRGRSHAVRAVAYRGFSTGPTAICCEPLRAVENPLRSWGRGRAVFGYKLHSLNTQGHSDIQRDWPTWPG